MEILVAILIIAVIAAVAYAVIQHRQDSTAPARRHSSPLGRRDRGAAGSDPMAAAVAEHAQATHPQDVVAAEHRLQAQAGQVAAGLTADAHRNAAAEHQRAADEAGHGATYAEPVNDGQRFEPAAGDRVQPRAYDAPVDPAYDDDAARRDERAAADRHDDPRHDGRRAEDWAQRHPDDRTR